MRKHILIFNVLLIWIFSTATAYQQITDNPRWEDDIRNFEHLDSTETYSDQAILFIGSSSIRLWSTLAEDMVPYEVIQRGYGGARLSDLVIYAERIIYPHPCRAIVLFVANDITGNEEDKSPLEVRELAKELFSIIRTKKENIPVFYIATTPTPLRWKVWPKISEANEGIKDFCEEKEHTYFIETATAFLGDDNIPKKELFREDSLHLNAAGYKVWSGIIRRELRYVIGE